MNPFEQFQHEQEMAAAAANWNQWAIYNAYGGGASVSAAGPSSAVTATIGIGGDPMVGFVAYFKLMSSLSR